METAPMRKVCGFVEQSNGSLDETTSPCGHSYYLLSVVLSILVVATEVQCFEHNTNTQKWNQIHIVPKALKAKMEEIDNLNGVLCGNWFVMCVRLYLGISST